MISIDNGGITLENSAGCRLALYHEGGKYGLGAFYVNGKKIGGTVTTFLNEDNHYVWDPYLADRYEIIEDSAEKSVIRFHGQVGGGGRLRRFRATITLPDKVQAYRLDVEVDPTAFASPKYPLYVSVPFSNQAMEFVQYPFETPLTAPFSGQWYITPHLSKVPLMFGCEKIDGEDFFVGIGYSLTGQDYTKGRLQYDTWNPDIPFKVFFPYHWFAEGRFRPAPYKLCMVVSTALTQSDCIEAYMHLSDYDLSSPVRRTIDDSLAAYARAYKTVPVNGIYVEKQGYRMRARSNSDELPSYYPNMEIGRNAQLAHQLYKYWEDHPGEPWARTRAFEMADFYVASQEEDGAVALLWDPDGKKYLTHFPPLQERGMLYGTAEMCLAAYSIYRLYLERKRFESDDCQAWRAGAVKIMDYIVARMGPDGSLGRNYNKAGEYDDVYPAGWALIALDYLREHTGDEKYAKARNKAEKWNYDKYVRTNNYVNTCVDANAWRPEDPQYDNHDTQTAVNFANYYVYRHMKTNDPKDLQHAKDVVFYDWLERIPIQIPGYKWATRGLGQEQDIWHTFDAPWEVETRDCLPYLSAVTGDQFYAAWYKIIIQTQMAYQPVERKYPFNYIGLYPHPDREGPADKLAEGDEVWISFTSFFLEDLMNCKASARYLGGRTWGVGLDYDPAFTPNFGLEEPYVMRASSAVTSAWWDAPKKELTVLLNAKVDEPGSITINWPSRHYPAAGTKITIDGGKTAEAITSFDHASQTLKIRYTHNQPSIIIRIRAT